jgi:hypothetical protein
MASAGLITEQTVIRGPSTRQFWTYAIRTPMVANLIGRCHSCQSKVGPSEFSCRSCGAVFTPETDRQHLGLGPVRLLPGQAAPEIIAAASGVDEGGASAESPERAPLAPAGEERDDPAPRSRRSRRSAWLLVVPLLAVGLGVSGAMLWGWPDLGLLESVADDPGDAIERSARAVGPADVIPEDPEIGSPPGVPVAEADAVETMPVADPATVDSVGAQGPDDPLATLESEVVGLFRAGGVENARRAVELLESRLAEDGALDVRFQELLDAARERVVHLELREGPGETGA